MRLSREELFERVRRERRVDPSISIRALARKYELGRSTVRQALEGALPPPRKAPAPRESVLTPVMGFIDAMLRADLIAPRKQRHTIDRIHRRLLVEYEFDGASYSTVRDYVSRRRPQIVAEAREGAGHTEGMVPQVHEPGAEAEVDFADVWVRLRGELTKCRLFTLRLTYSGKAVHRVYRSQAQEAFLEGHVEAFRVLGGVPTRHVRYDNLKPAVTQVCFGRNRVESTRWVSFRSWYGFDPFYCLPGIKGAHEKGGVEHEGGRFRRKHLVPVVEVDSLTELNEGLAEIDREEDARFVHGNLTSVGFRFAAERGLFHPLPAEEFDCGVTLTPRVRRDSRIVVRQVYYSVPARFIGRQVRISLRANELVVFDGPRIVARHPRLTRRFEHHDVLDHYLEILLAKPGALAGSAALAQAREEGVFTPLHDAYWAAARKAHGDAEGTWALIEVLLLHRRMDGAAVLAGVRAVLEAGATSPQLVAIEARKAETGTGTWGDTGPDAEDLVPDQAADLVGGKTNVVSLRPRRLHLPDDTRPLPSVAAYDLLLAPRLRGTSA